MTNNYQCPYCHSSKVQDRITEIQCLDCGSIDILEDSFKVIYLPEEPPRPDPLPPILPEHHLMKKLLEVEGIANYAKVKIQEHLTPPKQKAKIIKKTAGFNINIKD